MVVKCDVHRTMNQNSNIWHCTAEIKEKKSYFTTLIKGFLPPDQMIMSLILWLLINSLHKSLFFKMHCVYNSGVVQFFVCFSLAMSSLLLQFVIQFVLNDAKPKIKLFTKIQSTNNHTKNTLIWCMCYYLCLLFLSIFFFLLNI